MAGVELEGLDAEKVDALSRESAIVAIDKDELQPIVAGRPKLFPTY